MHIPCSNFGMELVDGLIFAISGYNCGTTTCKVEYYNIETDEWTEADDVNICRIGLSCCLVTKLPPVL